MDATFLRSREGASPVRGRPGLHRGGVLVAAVGLDRVDLGSPAAPFGPQMQRSRPGNRTIPRRPRRPSFDDASLSSMDRPRGSRSRLCARSSRSARLAASSSSPTCKLRGVLARPRGDRAPVPVGAVKSWVAGSGVEPRHRTSSSPSQPAGAPQNGPVEKTRATGGRPTGCVRSCPLPKRLNGVIDPLNFPLVHITVDNFRVDIRTNVTPLCQSSEITGDDHLPIPEIHHLEKNDVENALHHHIAADRRRESTSDRASHFA